MPKFDASQPSLRLTFSVTVAMCAGLLPVYFVPFFIGTLERDRGISPGSAALIGSAEIAATAITAILMGRFRRIHNFQKVILTGAFLGFVANLASIVIGQFAFLLALRLLAGLGSGLFFGAATIVIARQAKPDRVYGRVFAWCAVFFTVAMLVLPLVLEREGATGYFLTDIVVVAAAAAPFRTFRGVSTHASVIAAGTLDLRLKVLLYLILAALFLPIGGLWGLAGQIAHAHGLSLRATGIGLAISNAAGFIGGELSRRVGLHSGVFLPIAASACGLVLVALGLSVSDTATVFVLSMGVLGAIYLFIISHLVSTAAMLDRSGIVSSELNGSNLIAISIGTAAFGALLGHYGMSAVVIASSVLCSAALPPAWTLRSAVKAPTRASGALP